ncbi:MAG: NAD-dependent epimerase/dehydratase family protein [Planctomycetota bacterium]|nr:NAD-dependent epimerase/dehydratase family protein [Planctomycetota bacterium]
MPPPASIPDRPSRVVVAGGAGLIGSAVVRALARGPSEVLVLDRRPGPGIRAADLANPRTWRRELADFGPADAILLLAGVVGVARVLADPEAARRGNLAPVEALLAALAHVPDHDLPRIVYASSSEVYLPARRPLREDDPVRAPEEVGRWAYAAAKVAGERRLAAARVWPVGRAPVAVRFFNVVGPGQESAQGMVLPTFVERARAGLPLCVHGDGAQVRTLAHVDEIAPVLVELSCRSSLPGGPLNVGGVARCSVLEIAQAVLRRARSVHGARIEHVDPRRSVHPTFEDVIWRVPDLARLAALGIALPTRDLDTIVQDVWARHDPANLACASPAS